jgi:hypothetical protein
MQAKQANNPLIVLPINLGTRPDWQPRLGYPKLRNMFVGESGFCYCDPGLMDVEPNAPDENTRKIWYTPYGNGAYIAVTKTQILKLNLTGGYTVLKDIRNTGQAVQIAENEQNQIGIVDGRNFYVYDQSTGDVVTMGAAQGFQFTRPISIIVLNNICIVLDYDTSSWAISTPDNMLEFPVLDNIFISPQLTDPVGLVVLNNNMFIFGTTGIERWIPSLGNNLYIFPFSKDTSFLKDFGAIATNGISKGYDEVFFLSSKYTPMSLTVNGFKDLGAPFPNTGYAKIFSQYPDVTKCESSFFPYRGNFFFTMTFVDSGVCWKYCTNSNTFSLSDDLVVSGLKDYSVVATPDGIFNLTLTQQATRLREWVGPRIVKYEGLDPYRNCMTGFEVRMIQGLLHNDPEQLELTLSLDGQQKWLNTVPRPIGKTGERNAITTWAMNISGYEFTPRIRYYGLLDLTIEKITATIE